MKENDEIFPFFARGISDNSIIRWADGMKFCIPHSTLRRCGLEDSFDQKERLLIFEGLPKIALEDVISLRLLRAFTEQSPLSSRLPFSYQRLPSWVRSIAAVILGRWQCQRQNLAEAFPMWPLDLSSDFLSDLAGIHGSPFASGPTPVILTHDLDTAEGLKNLVDKFLDIEEALGAHSANYIVPCSWAIDYGLLDEVKQRGNEIGVHGYDHSNLTPYLSTEKRKKRLQAARGLINRYGIIGYRAPSLLRTKGLLQDLGGFYRYDSSIPTSGGVFPVPNNGCASARPFHVEGIVEIPITMPRDGSLRYLGYQPDEIFDMWVSCAENIARSGGIIVLLTHCEGRFSGNPTMLKAYHRFLKYIAYSNRYEWSTPQDVPGRFLQHENGTSEEVRV